VDFLWIDKYMQIKLDINSSKDYELYLRIKTLPAYRFTGRMAHIPDEYQHLLMPDLPTAKLADYVPLPSLFDYQRDISKLAIFKKKFALFMQCGSGKSLCILEYARYIQSLISPQKRVLIITPKMVIHQFISEIKRFYANAGYNYFTLEQVRANRLSEWLTETGSAVGITNYEALKESTPKGRLGALILDESSMLKSEYGKYAGICIRLGSGLEWKLCATGTPAPNDRTEFANHALFLDQVGTVNAFLSKYFCNKGKTGARWELKGHGIEAFYRDLSHWSIFLNSPSVYGWKSNCDNIPPINVNIHDVDLTDEQKVAATDGTGMLFALSAGGITRRSKLSQIAKGRHGKKKIATNKYTYIKKLISSWPDESTMIWAIHNTEQDDLEMTFPGCASINGRTPDYKRLEYIMDFQSGKRKIMLSKSKILGLGLNMQIATRHVFSSCVDSFESFFQAIKRSNRFGSTKPLNVHIPISDLEVTMVENVLEKWKRVQEDMEICERIFKLNLHLVDTGEVISA
jgi:superfamily II DNA or RNA helicase